MPLAMINWVRSWSGSWTGMHEGSAGFDPT
jgi:hypothetical protein